MSVNAGLAPPPLSVSALTCAPKVTGLPTSALPLESTSLTTMSVLVLRLIDEKALIASLVPLTLISVVAVCAPALALTLMVRRLASPPVLRVTLAWPCALVLTTVAPSAPESAANVTLVLGTTALLASLTKAMTSTAVPPDEARLPLEDVSSKVAILDVTGTTLTTTGAETTPPLLAVMVMSRSVASPFTLSFSVTAPLASVTRVVLLMVPELAVRATVWPLKALLLAFLTITVSVTSVPSWPEATMVAALATSATLATPAPGVAGASIVGSPPPPPQAASKMPKVISTSQLHALLQ